VTTVNGTITNWNLHLYKFVHAATGVFPTLTFNSDETGDGVSFSTNNFVLGFEEITGSNKGCYLENPPASGCPIARGSWACVDPPPPDPLAATVANMRAQIAALTFERDEYVAMVRALNAAIAALERKK